MSTASGNTRVRIPADVFRADRVLSGLTAHQLAILTATAVAAYAIYTAGAAILPVIVATLFTMPVLAAGAAMALLQRDGVGLDQLIWHAALHARTPHTYVHAPEGIPAIPAWAAKPTDVERPAPVSLPVRTLSQHGVLDLGADGCAVIVECSTVSFALRTAEEQKALVGAFGRWLNSIAQPIQILVVAERINLRPTIERLRRNACALPDPALERAAQEHATFLAHLDASRDLLHRRVLLVVREPLHSGPGAAKDAPAAARRALRRAEDACRALAAAAVDARLLSPAEAAATLATCLDPDIPPGLTGQALPGQVITGDPAAQTAGPSAAEAASDDQWTPHGVEQRRNQSTTRRNEPASPPPARTDRLVASERTRRRTRTTAPKPRRAEPFEEY